MIITLRHKISIAGFVGRPIFAYSSLASFSLITIIIQLAQCSPPVDYFLYTAQSVQRAGTTPPSSVPILPPIESIYYTEELTGGQQQHNKQLVGKLLSLIQNISHTHDNDQVDLETTRFAWHLMEKQALHYMRRRVTVVQPIIESLLNESQVSRGCQEAIKHWLCKLQDLEQWAVLMWNSWGDFPPAGLFEGSFTDLGSYRGCLSIKDNELIGQAQYCTLDFLPLVPTRPRFHSVYKKVLDLDEQTNQLTAGDFIIEGNDTNNKINSSHAAHGFDSTKYQLLWAKRSGASKMPQGVRNKNSSQDALSIKLNKRTMPGTDSDSNKSSKGYMPTLNKQLLIELAHKAQYFYYIKFRVGACLPSKCSPADVQKLAQTAGQRAILQANPINCMKKEPRKLNGYQRVSIWILSTLAFMGVLGTIADILGCKANQNSFSLATWLLPFSIWANAKRLFDSKTAASHANLECIHGLRFFSMLWVIYGHTILYTEYQLFTHAYDIVENDVQSLWVLPTLNGNFSVDTFFVISGILTTYVTWEYIRGDARKFNKFAFAISRYLRLTPQLAIVILCFFLLPLFGDGPMYKQITEDQANLCYKNWFINLLYLQCYVNAKKICIDPSWWLSIEMTFHLISMVVIIAMISSPTRGMVVNFVVAAALTLWGAIIHYSNGMAISYLPSVPQKYEVVSEQTKMFFHKPFPHAASYFIGIALGYLLANKTVKKLSRSQVLLGWFVCLSGIIISLFGTYFWNLGASYTQFQATFYYHLCQIWWPISIAWIILACSLGHGGFVHTILSARFFVPLGRITYMTYLSHALIIYYHTASISAPVVPSMLLFAYIFLANTLLSLGLGVVLTVVYEVPVLNLQRMIFNRIHSPAEVTVISPADTNGLSNQLIIESDELVGTKNSQERFNNRNNSNTNNIATDNSKH